MPEPRQITIVGGGLAGLTLGIGLRQRGIPVAIWEAGTYPRHRVCGEFISGKGLEVLRELGIWDDLIKAGARRAETAAMIMGAKVYRHPLPKEALCISRYKLDYLLAEKFQQFGGMLKTGSRFAVPSGGGEGMVRATGRSAQGTESGWYWFGVKGHARNVSLVADLEMHYSQNAYVGLCGVDQGTVNVCGLFRRRKTDPKPGRELVEMLQGSQGELLHERLQGAQWDAESVCTVAGLSFGTLKSLGNFTCCVGDVVRMIPPLTGNGMSIAFESARLALDPLVEFATGRMGWREAEQAIAEGYIRGFRSRFWWANTLQRLAFNSAGQAFSGVLCSSMAFRFCFSKTR